MEAVLVALDGSQFAEQAIPVALDVARRHGVHVELLAVYEPPLQSHGGVDPRAYDPGFDQANRGALARYVLEEAEKLGRSGVTARGVVLDGSPAGAIAEYARETNAGVIVVTAHGRRGPSRMWLGSVTTELLHRATTPVLVLRAAARGEPAPRGAFGRVIIGLDGSPAGESAIAPARRVAGSANVEFVLARAVPTLQPFRHLSGFEDVYTRESREQQDAAEVYVARVAEALRHDGLVVQTATPASANEADALVNLAAEIHADLIVVGAHSRSRLERLFLGSVADKVVRTAPGAVLVCRVTPAESDAGTVPAPAAREPQLTRIAVAVDFSGPSAAAAAWVVEQMPDAEVTLIHAADVPQPPSFIGGGVVAREETLNSARQGAEVRLREMAAGLRGAGIRTDVEAGRPAEQLVRTAQELGADIIVVGEHGVRTGVARLLGSTAERVLRTATMPVLLARGLPDAPLRHVLVGVDDSDVTAAVLGWARAFCTRFGASATLLHVCDPQLVGALNIAASPGESRRARTQLRRASVRWLTERSQVLRDAGVDVVAEVAFGDPATRMLGRAKAVRADLIVAGRRGAGRVQRAIIGSVTDRVLRLGKGPVLVVPEPRD